MSEAKPGIMKRQADLLAERYDLANRPARERSWIEANRFRKVCA